MSFSNTRPSSKALNNSKSELCSLCLCFSKAHTNKWDVLSLRHFKIWTGASTSESPYHTIPSFLVLSPVSPTMHPRELKVFCSGSTYGSRPALSKTSLTSTFLLMDRIRQSVFHNDRLGEWIPWKIWLSDPYVRFCDVINDSDFQ